MIHFLNDPPGRSRGFTLLELAALLALLSGLIFALLYKTADVSAQQTLQETDAAMAAADAQLRQFAAWHGRLPCPDSDGDGVEDCSPSRTKGDLPYRTLGLATQGYEAGERGARAIRYGVYRNAALDADLAVQAERFRPTNADGTAYALDGRNSLDLCSALETAAGQAANDGQLFMRYPDGSRMPMAYLIATPGRGDADAVHGLYDALNGSSPVGFEAPQTPISPIYDDRVRGRGFAELHRLLQCEAVQRSLDLSANAIALEEENLAFAESNASSAEQGVLMNAVGSALTAWSMAQAGAGVAGANEVLTLSTSLLASTTAACAVPPFVACALVPVYTTAVASATTGLNLSIAALVVSGGALGLQGTSTGLYVSISGKTGVPDTVDTPSGVTSQMVDSAWDSYQQASLDALAAEAAHAAALGQYQSGAETETQASRAALEAEIDRLPGSAREAVRNALYGFPRVEDIDPDDPPSDPIIGVESAIDGWRSAEADAGRMSGVELVDEDGNPILDGNGNPLDLVEVADAARQAAETRLDEVRQLAGEAACSGTCDLRDDIEAAFDAHMAAYDAERQAWYQVEALRAAAEQARQRADGEFDQYGALNCAYQYNQDYDPQSDSCRAGPPGGSAQDTATGSVCDVASETYDATACATLQQAQSDNPICDTASDYYNASACAALGTSPGQVSGFRGMENLVRQLDAKGSVR